IILEHRDAATPADGQRGTPDRRQADLTPLIRADVETGVEPPRPLRPPAPPGGPGVDVDPPPAVGVDVHLDVAVPAVQQRLAAGHQPICQAAGAVGQCLYQVQAADLPADIVHLNPCVRKVHGAAGLDLA